MQGQERAKLAAEDKLAAKATSKGKLKVLKAAWEEKVG